jgi:hypothetical protein
MQKLAVSEKTLSENVSAVVQTVGWLFMEQQPNHASLLRRIYVLDWSTQNSCLRNIGEKLI